MVSFIKCMEDDKRVVFLYYTEADESKSPGEIVFDKEKEEIDVTKLAEGDWERDIPPEEINSLIDSINEMRLERGEINLEEHVTESEHSIMYGDHAVSEICKYISKGVIPEKGMQAWY